MIMLPLIPSAKTYSYPKASSVAPRVRYFPLDMLLTRRWTTDAHTTAYSVEHRPYRLSRDAIAFDGGVCMVLFIADVDGPAHLASDEWWQSELAKLDALRREFPGAFIYRTKGGYRIVYLLPMPVVLETAEAVIRWKASYLGWIAALRARFGIVADPACHDWQRLYRLPHATRTPGGRPESRETLGHPYRIGVWTCEPTADEQACAATLAKKPPKPKAPRERHGSAASAGDGVLFHAFQAKGWMGDAIEPGKWRVMCPWEDRHTKGSRWDTSTILFAPGSGETLGWVHCSHGHCQDRDIRDVLRLFSEEELERAERACGIDRSRAKPEAQPKRHVQMYKPSFSLRVKGVLHAS